LSIGKGFGKVETIPGIEHERRVFVSVGWGSGSELVEEQEGDWQTRRK